MFDDNDSSAVSGLTTGAKIAILAAVPFILLGVYFLIAPITELRTTTGAVFGCGTAISSPDDTFKSNICGPINTMYLYRGIVSIAVGAIIAGAGFFLFNNTNSDASVSGQQDGGNTRSFD